MIDFRGFHLLKLSIIWLLLLISESIQVSSWLQNSKVMAWQLNPQLYMVGASSRCTASKVRLSPLQNAMCTSGGYMDHMSSVNVGLLIALNECQTQFKNSKWNCSDMELEAMLEGVEGIKETKEDAFLHAASSAGIAHAIARSCRNGLISKCSCSEMERPGDLNNDWVWGGCGDNVNYGYQFASIFVDLRERESNHPKRSEALAKMLMNKHNNEAGRRLVDKQDTVACKCHGVSGSCTVKTCWQQLAPFRQIGDKLKQNFDSAMQVGFNRAGTSLRNKVKSGGRKKRRASKEELVYIKALPDVCSSILNSNLTISTTGRECNATSTGEDSCNNICCNKSYETKTVTVISKCNCKFQWCCHVECDECSEQHEKQFCL